MTSFCPEMIKVGTEWSKNSGTKHIQYSDSAHNSQSSVIIVGFNAITAESDEFKTAAN